MHVRVCASTLPVQALLMWRHLARVHMVSAPSWEGPYHFNGSDAACPTASSADPACKWWHLFDTAVDARGVEDPFMFTQPAAGQVRCCA